MSTPPHSGRKVSVVTHRVCVNFNFFADKTIIIVPLVVVVVVVACAIIGVIVFLHLKRRRAGNQPAGQTERTRLLQSKSKHAIFHILYRVLKC